MYFFAFDKSTVVKEHKEKIETLQNDKDSMAKKVGELTLELGSQRYIISFSF